MRIDIHFSEGQQFTPIFEPESDFTCQFGEFLIVHEADWYEGVYDVTPKITEQTMPTKDKTMREDVTIFSIPYAETTNIGGGYTATIGE